MDNLRRHKLPPNRTRASMDGFVPRGTSPHQRLQPKPVVDQKPRTLVDSFKAAEGFHPNPLRAGSTPLAQPIPHGRQPNRDDVGRISLDLPDLHPQKKKAKRSFRSGLRIATKSLMILIVSSVLVVGYLFGKGYLKTRQIFKGGSAGAAALQENVDITKLNGEGDGRVNILLLGKGGPGHEAPNLTDTILVASIDPIHKEASLLSIPRDLWVPTINGGGTKINSVYANTLQSYQNPRSQEAKDAGFKAIEQTVEDTMGIPIHYYVIIDFTGFEKAINTVGGVDVTVTKPVYEVMHIRGKPYVLDVKVGRQHFDGFRALAFARSRYTSQRGDFDRAERQRSILIALKDKIFSLGTFGNPLKISQLLSDFGNNMQSNLRPNEVVRLYEIGKDIEGGKIGSLGLADPPNNFVTTGNIGGLSVVIPRAGVGNFTEIRAFVRNSLKDAFIRDESATIAVFNGTNIGGLATSKATDLKSYGYNISQVADAPTKNYPKTILVDLTNGSKKYTKTYLEKRLNTTAVTSLPDATIKPEGADFVIILGQNESSNY